MKVCVFGLWHLGIVTASCVAQEHEVIGLDADPEVVSRLKRCVLPVAESGVADLMRAAMDSGRLTFTSDIAEACAKADVLWVTFDTPVDDQDRADCESVLSQVRNSFPHLRAGALVLVSSQLPVGSTGTLESEFRVMRPDANVTFSYSPENLRLGKAVESFTKPGRVVVGIRLESQKDTLVRLLAAYAERFEWMSVESAEMTKHALNAFLAVSVTFINEISSICEMTGADAREVERGLKSEVRIGPRAYLSPGSAFAGGTLARDIQFLSALGHDHGLPVHLLRSVLASNESHKEWARRKLVEHLGTLGKRTVAVWGLAYKPGTDTLRRSLSLELCAWLDQQGCRVHVHDPAVKALPTPLGERYRMFADPVHATQGCDALVVATEWPQYRVITANQLVEAMGEAIVLDPNRFLSATLESQDRIRYYTVGKAHDARST